MTTTIQHQKEETAPKKASPRNARPPAKKTPQQRKNEEAITQFLAANKNLVDHEAKKRFGERYNKSEIYAEAVIAYSNAVYERKKRKRTKLTSLFWFYLQKQLNEFQNIDVYEVSNNGHSPEPSEADNDGDWMMNLASMQADGTDLLDSYPNNEDSDTNYKLSVESFDAVYKTNTHLPHRLIRALSILVNPTKLRKKMSDIKSMYSANDMDHLISSIRNDLHTIERAGYRIYRAECLINTPESLAQFLNGSRAAKRCIAYACAIDRDQAQKHLCQFGEVINCKTYTPF